MARLKNTIEKKMFYGASSLIFERAKSLRFNPTDAEKKISEGLRNKQLLGLKFRFQHPLSQFIADFYCHKIKLVIEIDGGIHLDEEQRQRDIGRTFELEKYGIEVMRFSNEEVLYDYEKVLEKIKKKCEKLLMLQEKQPHKGDCNPHPPSLLKEPPTHQQCG
jgi:very-short-patch-repair endonuclease